MVPLTILRHTSRRGEYQGRKSAILDFYYSRSIPPPLFVFVQFIYLFGAKFFVRVRIRVTYPYIKKGGPLSLPESTTARKAKYSGPNSLEYGPADAAYTAVFCRIRFRLTRNAPGVFYLNPACFSVFKLNTRE